MGERKVLNKYIPADFDPSLIPRGKKLSAKDGTVPVRMMLPFSMQCQTCHTFLYRGRKYNSKKEAVQGKDGKYLGIQKWRFYIKCQHCSRPISFTTDPQNADYAMESGATRNFELHRNTKKEETDDDDGGGGEDGDKGDPMKALEDRVLDSQREMADLDNLEEIKALNARHLHIDPLEALQLEEVQDEDDDDDLLTAEDEALIRSIQFGKKQQQQEPSIKRLTEEDEARLDQQREEAQKQRLLQQKQQKSEAKRPMLPVHLKVVKKKKRRVDAAESKEISTASKTEEPSEEGALGLLAGYGSDSS